MTASIDNIDKVILKYVQEDARINLEELAAKANISKSAAQRRLQRLRASKIILGDIAVIDPKTVGPWVTMLVEVEFERDRPEFMGVFQKWIATQDHIQQAWCITGRGDYTLVVMTPSIEDFDSFMERLLNDNRYVRKFLTSVVLRTVKRSLTVPVSEHQQ